MVLIICTKNEFNLTNRYWDIVPDRQKCGRTERRTDGTDGWRKNYIPPTSSGDNNTYKNIKALGIVVSDMKIFFIFSLCETTDPWGRAIFGHRGII